MHENMNTKKVLNIQFNMEFFHTTQYSTQTLFTTESQNLSAAVSEYFEVHMDYIYYYRVPKCCMSSIQFAHVGNRWTLHRCTHICTNGSGAGMDIALLSNTNHLPIQYSAIAVCISRSMNIAWWICWMFTHTWMDERPSWSILMREYEWTKQLFMTSGLISGQCYISKWTVGNVNEVIMDISIECRILDNQFHWNIYEESSMNWWLHYISSIHIWLRKKPFISYCSCQLNKR